MRKKSAPVGHEHTPSAARTFGQWVRDQRMALGLTQDNLALRVACSKSTINKIEGGLRLPSKETLELLALHLKILPSDYARFAHLAQPALVVEAGDLSAKALALLPGKDAPTLPTSLIGREREMRDICALLQRADTRLITLTGPGGTGKSRLAAQVATELKGRFADGVYFIPLAPVHDPTRVLPTIAQSLGLKSARDQCDEALLIAYLQNKHLLLVLDNFEQVLPAAKALAEVIMFTSRCKVLVTSRAMLRLRGEQEFPIPPLALPHLKQLTDPDAITASPAVQLFAERAHAVRPDFALSPENARVVAEICVRLDGLPLAIELAAARCRIIPPEAILKRLSGTMGSPVINLLTGGSRDLPTRHQTLRQTMEWSYNLLDPQQRMLFRRLGVFMGGCTLEAIEEICEIRSLPSQPIRAHHTPSGLDLAQALMEQSLLRQMDEPPGEPRFVMLETLREYALECLVAANEFDMMSRRHALFFLRMSEAIEPRLHGPEQEDCLARLDVEYHNLRAALAWSIANDLEVALSLASTLWQFWLTRGYLGEARAWMSHLLQHPASHSLPLQRAKVLNGAGLLYWVQSEWHTADQCLQESLHLFREQGDVLNEAWVLNHLGQVMNDLGQKDLALAHFEHSLRLFRSLDARWHSAWVLMNLGDFNMYSGSPQAARQFLSESRDLFAALGDKRGMATAIDRLGVLAHWDKQFAQAMPMFAESHRLFKAVGDMEGSAWALYHLGNISRDVGKLQSATIYLVESLRLFAKLGDQWGSFWALLFLAQTAQDRQLEDEAALLFGVTDVLTQTFRNRLTPENYQNTRQILQKASAELSRTAWEKGQSLTSEKALELVLDRWNATRVVCPLPVFS